jgi:hypothetical protein
MSYKPPDMVERLRESPSCRELKIGIDAETTAIWHDLCCEAANEITRLTAELAEARELLLEADESDTYELPLDWHNRVNNYIQATKIRAAIDAGKGE